ncbi:MAG TPA: helix-turn-helix transcriptional regulator [Dehalococcoidia bacterium]|nr:helix-turn-helix transcriptional regulator [Dehalococcoidia bacterium]
MRKSEQAKKNTDESGAGKNSFQPRLTGDLLSSSLLAFLRRWNAYGYQLVQELGRAGLPHFDSTTVYRTLRQLERAGLVSSFWDTSESGPARRMYSLTKAGETFLDLWLDIFGRYQRILHTALDSLDNSGHTAENGTEAPPARSPGRAAARSNPQRRGRNG